MTAMMTENDNAGVDKRQDRSRELDILVMMAQPTGLDEQNLAHDIEDATESSLVVLEDGRPVEFLPRWRPSRIHRHDVVLGVVTRPMPGLDGAFVAVGTGHDGLLRLAKGEPMPKAGTRLMVRILRDERPGKGPVLSTSLAYPSRYAVLRPGLRPLRRSLVRTLPEHEAEMLFQKDLERLDALHGRLQQEAVSGPAPRRLFAAGDPLLVYLTAWPDRIRSIQVEGPRRFTAVEDLLREQAPDLLPVLRLHPPHSTYDLAAVHRVSDLGRQIAKRTVPLPGGGSLVFDRTEALWVIDVNSQSATGKDKRELAKRVNQEAVREIARQLRLRNLAGMIVVDLIRTDDPEERESLVSLLRTCLSGDRGKTDVYGFGALSLLEMIRTAP